MSTTLCEKVIDIIENSDLNSLPLEERKKIIKYNKEQQILTLWQVLNNYKEYTSPYFRKKLSNWLKNCIASYTEEIDNAPTVEEPERLKGEWILNKDENPECPYCHHSFSYWGNFCGNCGADLR